MTTPGPEPPEGERAVTMLCQVCGAANPEEQEYCVRCHHKLLVLSGPLAREGEAEGEYEEGMEESISFDEHLLERISILEEAVKRIAETVQQLLGTLQKQEHNILVSQTGVAALREVLEGKELVEREEWIELWEAKMDFQLLALEKRERFLAARDKIAALFHGDDRRRFLEHLEEAEYALFSFDVDGALAALQSAFELDRDNYELAALLGETHFNEGDPEGALACFERVLEVNPEHYEGLVYGGVLSYERGSYDQAEELLQRAVALYPERFLPCFSLGAVYAGQERLEQAVVFLERAVEIEPVPQALYLLGNCLYESRRLSAAIKTLEEAVRQDSDFEEAYHLLGLAYLDRRWTKKALEAFRRAQRLNPKKLQYQDLVRYLSGSSGSPLPPVGTEANRWLSRGERSLGRGNAQQAALAYRRALAVEPDNPTLLMNYAMLCLRLDRCQEIEAVTRRVLDLEPGEMLEATAYAALIEALRSQGRYREGNRIGKKLLTEGSSNFSKTIAYYEMAYNLAEMEEDLDSALDYARRSLELAPEELKQFPLAALGWVHYKRREFDRAVDFLSRSSELGPSTTTLTHLGMALLASGHGERAKSVLARARRLSRRDEALGEKMMEVMKESGRLLERVRARQRR